MTRAEMVRAALLLTAVWAAAGIAAAQTPSAAALEAAHRAARGSAVAAAKARAESERARAKACKEADEADEKLRDYPGTSAGQLLQLATDAQAAQLRCEEARRDEKRADGEQAAASAHLRHAAVQLAQCLAGTAACDGPQDAAGLIAAAAAAQEAMDQLRKKGAGAYETGDTGTKTFLDPKLSLARGEGGLRDPVRADALAWGNQAQALPRELRKTIIAAQSAADHLVGTGIELKRCLAETPAACEAQLTAARAAQEAFSREKTAAEAMQSRLQKAGYGLAVVAETSEAPDKDAVAKLIAFRQIVDSNADVKSFFGGDAVGWSAGTVGTNATIRYTMQAPGNFKVNRFSLIASTPTGTNGVTRFTDAADKLKDKSSLSLVWQRTNAPFRLPLDVINDFALGLKATREKHEWKVAGTSPTGLAERSAMHSSGEASLQWAFLFNGAIETRSLLLVKLARQRAFKEADEVVRCPFDPAATDAAGLLECAPSRIGAPTVAYNTVNALEFRQRLGKLDLGLKVTHSRTDGKTDFELPLYFIRNLDDKTDTPFSGGLSLNWNSGTSGLRWGLFVATPLTFTKPER